MEKQTYDVVIIDDEPSVTDLFQHYILWKYKSWHFMTFNNPSILFTAVSSGQVAAKVWVLDMMMPQKNGADLAVAIREQQGHAPIIMAYTALEKRSLETNPAYQHGIHHLNQVINKREDIPAILSLIEVWIAQRS